MDQNHIYSKSLEYHTLSYNKGESENNDYSPIRLYKDISFLTKVIISQSHNNGRWNHGNAS